MFSNDNKKAVKMISQKTQHTPTNILSTKSNFRKKILEGIYQHEKNP